MCPTNTYMPTAANRAGVTISGPLSRVYSVGGIVERVVLRVEQWDERKNTWENVATLYKHKTSLAEVRDFMDDFMTDDTYEIEVVMRRR